MRDADGVSHGELERIADEIHAEHESGMSRSREKSPVFVYRGLRSNQSRRRRYADSRFVRVNGGHARMLDDYEVAEFRWAIDRIIAKRVAECV